MSAVLATVGVPPVTCTAPPLTRIVPARLRLTVIVLLRASPKTVSVADDGRKVAVTAGRMRSCNASTLGANRSVGLLRMVRGLKVNQRRAYLRKRRNMSDSRTCEREITRRPSEANRPAIIGTSRRRSGSAKQKAKNLQTKAEECSTLNHHEAGTPDQGERQSFER